MGGNVRGHAWIGAASRIISACGRCGYTVAGVLQPSWKSLAGRLIQLSDIRSTGRYGADGPEAQRRVDLPLQSGIPGCGVADGGVIRKGRGSAQSQCLTCRQLGQEREAGFRVPRVNVEFALGAWNRVAGI